MPLTKVKEQAAKAKKDADKSPASAGVGEYDFFRVKRDADQNFRDVQILQAGFLKLLRRLGYFRYDSGDSFEIIRIENNIIETVPLFRLREAIVKHFMGLPDEVEDILGCPKDALIEKLHRSLGTLTTEEKLALLVPMGDEAQRQISLVEDTKEAAYYFFRNGFVEVKKDGYKLRPYSELPGMIWRDQIIPRDFRVLKPKEIEEGVYWKFANNVAGNANGKDPERLASFLTITGYNLHRYFDTKLKCTIFLDARMSEEADGRSGKSLHTKAMQMVLNADPHKGRQMVIMDGKKYDPNNRFAFDQLHASTKVIVMDDVKRNFQIEDFFHSMLEGLERERKGDTTKLRIFAKLIFTLNYTMSIQAGSAKDRVVEFEFADYYSYGFSPEMEFKHWFFRDWAADEWERFDNFMMVCVLEYLRNGLILPNTINLEARKLKEETAQSFISFMEDEALQHEVGYDKKALYRKFLEMDNLGNILNKDFRWLKQGLFTKWLKLWAAYRPEIAGYKESRSNGVDFIRFFNNAPVTTDYLEGAKLFPGKSDRCTPAGGLDLGGANTPNT